VIEGSEPPAEQTEPGTLAAEVAERVEAGASRRDAIAAVAAARGVPKNAVYKAVTES